MKALVIVDMLEDFVHGALANPQAEAILPPLKELLAHFRRAGWVVVFANDAHEPGDAELAIWGEHAMAGTAGAQVVAELAPWPGPLELIVLKRVYGAFDGTELDERLRALNVDEVVLTGQHMHICIRHTAYGLCSAATGSPCRATQSAPSKLSTRTKRSSTCARSTAPT
ncbi:MAG: cysteine hydrolase family protein [Gaiellaceae bacterium]